MRLSTLRCTIPTTSPTPGRVCVNGCAIFLRVGRFFRDVEAAPGRAGQHPPAPGGVGAYHRVARDGTPHVSVFSWHDFISIDFDFRSARSSCRWGCGFSPASRPGGIRPGASPTVTGTGRDRGDQTTIVSIFVIRFSGGRVGRV